MGERAIKKFRKQRNKCPKCHNDQTKDTGHRQKQGHRYCPNTNETYEDWLKPLNIKSKDK